MTAPEPVQRPSDGRWTPPSTASSALRRLAALVAIVFAAMLPLAGVAVAEPPSRLAQQITDSAGVLSDSDKADIQNAMSELDKDKKIQLWVAYTKTFDGQTGQQWANSTGELSGFGSSNLLLAVAVDDRAYGYYRPDGFPLSDSEVQKIMDDSVRPKLTQSDWAGAAIALATELGGGSGSAVWWVVGGVVVIGGGGYLYYRSRRRNVAATGASGGAGTADGPAQPTEPLEDLDALNQRAVNALIQTDNAVRSSQNELATAQTEFGQTETAEFRTQVEQSMAELTSAFQIRQELDDDIPEDEPTKRTMLAQILEHCQKASDGLEDQTDRFINLRDLKGRLPQVLAALPGQIDAMEQRLPAGTASLQRLAVGYSPAALVTVSGNVAEAERRVHFARTALEAAQQTPATGEDPNAQVLRAAEAQAGLQQAGTLLDAIDRLGTDLTTAATELPAARQRVAQELAQVTTAIGAGDTGSATTELNQRLAAIRSKLAAADDVAGMADPLSALRAVTEADHELDGILADAGAAQQRTRAAKSALQNAMTTAQSSISAASDFIDTRRGVVGSEARTRLAEAQRHFTQALALQPTDTDQALQEAHQAVVLSKAALDLAQQDVNNSDTFSGGGFGGGQRRQGSGIGGAILGGILINEVLNAGRRGGGWGGGFGGWGGGGGGGFGGGGGGFGGGGGGASSGGGRF